MGLRRAWRQGAVRTRARQAGVVVEVGGVASYHGRLAAAAVGAGRTVQWRMRE
jgi:hypothetical protein